MNFSPYQFPAFPVVAVVAVFFKKIVWNRASLATPNLLFWAKKFLTLGCNNCNNIPLNSIKSSSSKGFGLLQGVKKYPNLQRFCNKSATQV